MIFQGTLEINSGEYPVTYVRYDWYGETFVLCVIWNGDGSLRYVTHTERKMPGPPQSFVRDA